MNINYRAWVFKENCHYGIEAIDFKHNFVKVIDTSNSKFFLLDQVILEKSTGKLDENGIEIYEGDIIEELNFRDKAKEKYFVYTRHHHIVWDEEYMQWVCLDDGKESEARPLHYIISTFEIRVIGHTHKIED